MYLELSDHSEIWQALQQQCCRCGCQISKRYDNLKYQSHGFETLRDLTKRRLFGYWDPRAHFLSLARSKLRLCSANHRAGYFSNMACDWLSIAWAYSEQETKNEPWFNIAERLFNTLRPRQNGRHFADGILKYIFLNENVWIPIKISLRFVPKGPINNIQALV